MGFRQYVLKRIGISIVLAFVAISIIFAVIRMLPGSPFSTLIATGNLTGEQIEAIRAQYGLNQPIYVQYLKYVQNLMTFDFGYSIAQGRPVWEILRPKLLNTLVLLVPALITTAIISTLLGMYAGWERGSQFEKLSIVTTTFFRSTPSFVTGIFLLFIFAYNLGWFPVFGMRSPIANPDGLIETYVSMDFLHHFFLPFLTSVLFYSGDFLLLSRNSVVEKKGDDFLKLHKAKGLSETEQLLRAGRNSLLPVVTYFALRMGMLFQGSITLEVVFGWPGIGRALIQAIQQQDYPTVQAAVFIMALAVIIANLISDLVYAKLDPTVETGGTQA